MLYLYVVFAVFCYSLSSLAKNYYINTQQISSNHILITEYCGATILTLLYAFFAIHFQGISIYTIILLILNGLIWTCYSYYNLKAQKNCKASQVDLIETSRFALIVLFAVFVLNEQLSILKILGLALIIIPVLATTNLKKLSWNSGTVFALLSALMLASGTILDKVLADTIVSLPLILLTTYLIPATTYLKLEKNSLRKTLGTLKKYKLLLTIPLIIFIADILIIYCFRIGGELITVSVIAESGAIMLVFLEAVILSLYKDFTMRLAMTSLNLLGILLVII